MKKCLLFLFLFTFCLLTAQVKVVEDSLFSESLNCTMKFGAILPDGYSKSQERYLTVYLLHGFSGNYMDWIRLTELVRYVKEYRFIIITPDAKNSWYANSPALQNAAYEDYVIKDVIPFVDKKYRTVQSKFFRAIAGLSMGGYGSAKFGLKYPNMFFFSGCLSPAIQFPNGMEDSAIVARRSKESNESLRMMFGFPRNEKWKENDVFKLLENSTMKNLPYFYLSVGSQDVIPEIIDLTHSFAAALRKKGAAFEMHEYIGGHDWKLWNQEIETVLQRIKELSQRKR